MKKLAICWWKCALPYKGSHKLVHTSHFTTLYQKKQEIEGRVIELFAQYDYQRALENRIASAEEEVDAALRRKNLNASFLITQRKPPRWVLVKTDSLNTLCGAEDCYSNCHVPCTLEKSFDKEVFKNCRCIFESPTGIFCSKCGHHYRHHYHNELRWEMIEETAEELVIDSETKRRFEEAATMEERAMIYKQQLEYDKSISEQKRKRLSECFLETLREFHTLGINRNYVKLLENQLAMIEQRLEGTTGPETCYLREAKAKLNKELEVVQANIPGVNVSIHESSRNSLDEEPSSTKNEETKGSREITKVFHHSYKQVKVIPFLLLLAILLVMPLLLYRCYNYYYSDHVVERQLIE